MRNLTSSPLSSWLLFQKIVDDCRGQQVREFCPFIHGEPLSWEYLAKGLEYLSRTLPDTGVVIYTNGYLLDPVATSLLLRGNISEVHFSIDGLSKAIYEQQRRGLVYERVIANVTHFLAELRQRKSRISTNVALTLTELNRAEVEAFRLFWSGLVDNVVIVPCDGRGGGERTPAFSGGRQLPCFQARSHTYILSDGSVVPCCKDWAGYSVLGNVAEQSLKAIWNSVVYRKFRDDINKGITPDTEVCRRCLADRL